VSHGEKERYESITTALKIRSKKLKAEIRKGKHVESYTREIECIRKLLHSRAFKLPIKTEQKPTPSPKGGVNVWFRHMEERLDEKLDGITERLFGPSQEDSIKEKLAKSLIVGIPTFGAVFLTSILSQNNYFACCIPGMVASAAGGKILIIFQGTEQQKRREIERSFQQAVQDRELAQEMLCRIREFDAFIWSDPELRELCTLEWKRKMEIIYSLPLETRRTEQEEFNTHFDLEDPIVNQNTDELFELLDKKHYSEKMFFHLWELENAIAYRIKFIEGNKHIHSLLLKKAKDRNQQASHPHPEAKEIFY